MDGPVRRKKASSSVPTSHAVLVLDEAMQQPEIARTFGANRFAFTLVATERDALARLCSTEQSFDAAIIDVYIRGRVIRPRLFTELAKRRVAVVVASAHDRRIAARIAADHKTVCFLSKPAPPKALTRALRAAVARSMELRSWGDGRAKTPARSSRNSVPVDGNAVRMARRARAWRQEDLANAAGLDARTIGAAEAGNAVSLVTLRNIARALDVPPQALMAAT